MRHFLELSDFDNERLTAMLDTAAAFKAGALASKPLDGKTVGMIFEKPSNSAIRRIGTLFT